MEHPLKRRRENRNMPLRQVSALLEETGVPIAWQTLSNWERGQGGPRAIQIVALAEVLGVSPGRLFRELADWGCDQKQLQGVG